MAIYEILNDDDEVINTVVADLEFVEAHYPDHFREVEPPAPVPEVPQTVSPFQAKVALLQAELLDDVEAYINSESADRTLTLAWNNAIEYQRQSPLILGVADALGFSDQQLDDLFIAASQVTG